MRKKSIEIYAFEKLCNIFQKGVIFMSIIERITQIMDTKNLNQSDLCKILGIKDSTFSTWKTRGTDPPAKYILLICEYLGVSVDYLLGRTNTPSSVQPLTSQDQITTEMLKAFEKLSFKDKIAVLNYALNIEIPPSIVQNKKTTEDSTQVPYVARDLSGKNTKGFIDISNEALMKGETDDYSKYD